MKHFDFWGFKRERSMSLSPSLLRRKVTLKSSNGIIFEIDEAVAFKLQMIKFAIEDCDDNVIQLPNVMSKILEKLVEYCKKHIEDEQSSPYKQTQEDLKTFDFQFVKVDHSTLFDLIHAANCLNIKSLLNLTCGAVGDMIKGKTPREIYKIFNIKNEFTPEEEEEEEVRREYDWAFE